MTSPRRVQKMGTTLKPDDVLFDLGIHAVVVIPSFSGLSVTAGM